MLGRMRAGGLGSEREGGEDREKGREAGKEGGRQGWRMLCPGLTSVGRWEFLASSSSSSVCSSWRGMTERLERRRWGLGQLLQLLLAEVRCRPLHPGLRLTQGCQQSRSPLPPPAPRPALASGSGPDRR